MHDIKWIVQNPQAFDAAMAKRGMEPISSRLIELDEKRRQSIAKSQGLQERRNAASKEIGKAMAAKDQAAADQLKAEVADIKQALTSAEEEERQLERALN